MSLLISCEVGGERIPDWLLQTTGIGRPAGSSGPEPQLDGSPTIGLQTTGSQTIGSIGDGQRTGRSAGIPLAPNGETPESESRGGSVVDLAGATTKRSLPPRPTYPAPWSQLLSAADRPARYAAERIAHRLGVPLIANEHPIELIDVTRSLPHRKVHSKLTKTLSSSQRERLVSEIYDPYIQHVRASIASLMSQDGFLIHLSVRSFNLKNRGKIRRTDVGLLYDPSRGDEVDLCLDWIDEMWERAPMLRVRRNYPRRGTSEGLTRRFRREFATRDYLGIEIWLNRAWARRPVALRDEAIDGIADSLRVILEDESNGEAESNGDTESKDDAESNGAQVNGAQVNGGKANGNTQQAA